MKVRGKVLTSALTVICVTLGACGVNGSDDVRTVTSPPAQNGPSTGSTASSTPMSASEPPTTSATTESVPPEVADDPVLTELRDDINAVVENLNAYWARNIDGYSEPGEVIPYISDEAPFPSCGPEEIQGPNAFYCSTDNTVVLALDWFYDENVKIGDTFTFFVLAHEWGHSAQANLSVPDNDQIELQADCFAGAFLQDSILDGSLTLEEGDEVELNQSIASAANEYGVEERHGTLAQRATAVESGRTNGAQSCVDDYGPT